MENASEDPVVVWKGITNIKGLLYHMNKYLSISIVSEKGIVQKRKRKKKKESFYYKQKQKLKFKI